MKKDRSCSSMYLNQSEIYNNTHQLVLIALTHLLELVKSLLANQAKAHILLLLEITYGMRYLS